ncbi:TPA: fimbria/pilus outer membrane usher protein [Serratia fonticola]
MTNNSPHEPDIAKNVEFDSSFLNAERNSSIDLSRFANGSSALPGTYSVEVYVNSQPAGTQNVEFKSRDDNSVFPCLTTELIKNINFNYDVLPKEVLAPLSQGQNYIDLQQQLPQAKATFDSSEQRLDIYIPEIYMKQTPQGSVSPALWDSGVPAAMLNYNLNGYSSRANGTDYNSFYAGLNTGVNVGAWFFRHNGSYNWSENGPKKYNTINTYVQRDIPVIKGRIVLGQANTTGQVFDTLPFSGVELASDERMLPESQRGYAPDIHGVARTNAKVTISQSGQVIYQKNVSPGEFLINDLYPTGYGGDLVVTVREADGSENVFTVPYASVTQLLRPGAHRYELTAGKLRMQGLRDKPQLYQGTYQRGLTNVITVYGGVQANPDYYAAQVGLALGTNLGAWSFDVTQAKTQLGGSNQEVETSDLATPQNIPAHADSSMSGQSYRLSYSKTISETNSNLSLAAYRFSTNGYLDFMTAMQTRDVIARGNSADTIWRAKSRLTITASQGLPGNWGQFYVSSSLQNYWNKEGTNQQFQVGYSNHYRSMTYSISANRTYSGVDSSQNNYMLNFSTPLGGTNSRNRPQMQVNLNRDTSGNVGEQVSVSGSGGADNQYSYGISAMNANNGVGSSGTLNGQYSSPMTSMSGAVGAGQNYQNASMGLSGTVVAHPGGVTFSPYQAETVAVVEAKGAEGALVSSYPGIKIDRWGYAVVPYLSPYKLNEISIDPVGTASDVELDSTTQKVAPYAGAVVMVKYKTKRGTPLLIMSSVDGSPVPFGANVIDSRGNNVGSVGQGGQIYARVTDERGTLRVKWGEAPDMQCRVEYVLMPQQKGRQQNEIQRFNTLCRIDSTQNNGGSGEKRLANFVPGTEHVAG